MTGPPNLEFLHWAHEKKTVKKNGLFVDQMAINLIKSFSLFNHQAWGQERAHLNPVSRSCSKQHAALTCMDSPGTTTAIAQDRKATSAANMRTTSGSVFLQYQVIKKYFKPSRKCKDLLSDVKLKSLSSPIWFTLLLHFTTSISDLSDSPVWTYLVKH